MFFHLSLNVSDLKRSVDFYRTLLGKEPEKNYDDYAKFELADPPVVLALEPGKAASSGTLNHLGIRVPNGEMIREFYQRLAVKGIESQFISGIQCCYSQQSKIVTRDPDNNLVEVYVLEADLDKPTLTKPATETNETTPARETRSYEHMIGTALMMPFDFPSDSLDETTLRGTFNDGNQDGHRMEILKEAFRTLRPGGLFTTHLLVGDRPVQGQMPKLPPPAQHVNHVPVGEHIVEDLETAGFTNIFLTRLSHTPVFVFQQAAMRELLLTATKPLSKAESSRTVVYKGPFRELKDDRGCAYPRGKAVRVEPETWAILSPFADHFVVLNEDVTAACRT